MAGTIVNAVRALKIRGRGVHIYTSDHHKVVISAPSHQMYHYKKCENDFCRFIKFI